MSRLLVLLISLAAGGGAAWLSMREPPAGVEVAAMAVAPAAAERRPAVELKLEEVLVAAIDLEHRRKLTPDDLRWQPWPADTVTPGFITRAGDPEALDHLRGSIVRVAMLAGEPIRQEKIVGGDAGFLSALLPAGKRAVAVRVSAETTAGGFILPDDRVDVLHTTMPSNQEQTAKGGVSRTILTNIGVLAVDQMVSADDPDTATSVARTVTLELDPLQAEVVAAAEASGSLSLALRSSADNHEAPMVADETERTVHIIGSGRTQIVRTK